MKFCTETLYKKKNPVEQGDEFRENSPPWKATLYISGGGKGEIHFYAYFLHLLPDFTEIRYKRSAHNAVEDL